ncbi:MAG: hypothetical protein NTV21_09370 [Planctomycetota bacterium]|nr:hypothetical protein [Planctomycetota bacterium]
MDERTPRTTSTSAVPDSGSGTGSQQLVRLATTNATTELATNGISRRRKILAFAIAALSDVISIPAELAPPIQWTVDGLTAFALFAVMGWRWALLPVLVVEAVPVLGMFPTWTLAVSALIATTPTSKPNASPSTRA